MKKKIAEEKVIGKRMTRSQKEILNEGTRSKKRGRKIKGKNSTESSSSKKVKINKESKKKRKIKSKKIVSIRTKTAATALFSAMNVLNPKRKKCLIKMGFGSLIGMKIHEIPGALGHYVISNLDVEKMQLPTSNGNIKVTEQKVHDILGIPFGEKAIDTLEERNADDPFLKDWFQQFESKSGKNDVRPNDIMDVIVGTKDCGKMFKMNFLMLFANTMGMCETSGACCLNVLKKVNDNVLDRAETLNWCKFIIDCLATSIRKWDNKLSRNFIGPITFMIVSTHY